jgi:hypothetical protein
MHYHTYHSSSPSAWEETGEMPDDKNIKIHASTSTTSSPTTPKLLLKQPPRKRQRKAITEKAADYLTTDPSNASASLMGNHTHKANIPTTAAINTKSPHQQSSLPPSPTSPPANSNQNFHPPGTNHPINTPDPNTPAPQPNNSVAGHNLASPNRSYQSNLASTILISTAATDTTGPSETPACDVLIAPPNKPQIPMLLQIQRQLHLLNHHHHSLQAPIQLQPSTTHSPS